MQPYSCATIKKKKKKKNLGEEDEANSKWRLMARIHRIWIQFWRKMNLCRFNVPILKATTQSSIRSQYWRTKVSDSGISIEHCEVLKRLFACTTKLCIPSGKFKTWMIDVLPQIASNEKKLITKSNTILKPSKLECFFCCYTC